MCGAWPCKGMQGYRGLAGQGKETVVLPRQGKARPGKAGEKYIQGLLVHRSGQDQVLCVALIPRGSSLLCT